MKTAISINDRILELYQIDETNAQEDYYPNVIQIAISEDYISLHLSAWPVRTDCNLKVFLAPVQLWQVVEKSFVEIEKFILSAITSAQIDNHSHCYIFRCDNGYMFWGPYHKKEDNWITFMDKARNIIVGRHHRKDNRQKDIDEGLIDGTVIPIAEKYFDFILNSLASRIRSMRDGIAILFSPF